MNDWFAVYRDSDGELVSTGSVVADPLPLGLTKKLISGPPNDQIWNPATLGFDARPAVIQVDRVVEFLANLPPNKRGNAVETEVTRLLGPFQFRDIDESYEL